MVSVSFHRQQKNMPTPAVMFFGFSQSPSSVALWPMWLISLRSINPQIPRNSTILTRRLSAKIAFTDPLAVYLGTPWPLRRVGATCADLPPLAQKAEICFATSRSYRLTSYQNKPRLCYAYIFSYSRRSLGKSMAHRWRCN